MVFISDESFVPKNKFDFEAVERIRKADETTIKPYLHEIFEWVEDINWPVAKELVTELVRFDVSITPFLIDLIQRPNGLREYSVYYFMLPLLSKKQLQSLKVELERIAHNPTTFEREEDYDKIAREYLAKIEEQ